MMIIVEFCFVTFQSKIDSEGLPGVYVRVGSFIKWIQAVLKTEFEDSP